MQTALLLLLFLIGMAPAALVLDGPRALGFGSAALSIAIIGVARAMRPDEATHLGVLVRPVAFVAALPALVMVLQAIPMPTFPRLANPIWGTAAAALGQPLVGSISMDSGSTVLSLCRYLAWLATGILACAVAIDRRRAKRVLFAVTSATALIASLLIVNDASGSDWLNASNAAIPRGGALSAAAMGIILSAACGVRAYERFETHRKNGARSMLQLASTLGVCAAALAACTGAVVFGDSGNSLFAAAAGLTTLLGVVLIRRLGLGPWGAAAAAATGCLIAFGIIATRIGHSEGSDLTVAFAELSTRSVAITQRMLADSTWTGTGAGTYHALVPIYRDLDDAAGLAAPSAAAEVVVECGRPLFWAGVLAVVAGIALLLRAGLTRGRDWFYPTAAASVLIALLVAAFGNAGLFGPGVLIITGAILGLGLAQSRSSPIQ